MPLLELVESSNVDRLNEFLEILNLLLHVIDRHEIVNDGGDDLQLLHTVSNRHKLGYKKDKSVNQPQARESEHIQAPQCRPSMVIPRTASSMAFRSKHINIRYETQRSKIKCIPV